MNTRLLRLGRRHRDGSRQWAVPGAPNAIKMLPAHMSLWGVRSVSWPALDRDGSWMIRGCRLDWHRSVAKNEITKLLEGIPV